MNTKTTLFLAVLLVLVGALYFVIRSRPKPTETETPPPTASSPVARDLIEEKLGDIVKVVCQRKNGVPWVFEKETKGGEGGQVIWRMTSPRPMTCTRWEVDKFGNRVARLKYELSYKPGEPGAMTPAQAGLDPPEAVVTLTDAGGRSATVEIGKSASRQETYVRVAGAKDIVVGQDSLNDLVKDKLLDYREKQVFDFDPANVKQVEITDRSDVAAPVGYVFNREGDRWMMASPVTARATKKIEEMITAMGRLRVVQWQDDDAAALATYGLDPGVLTVRATVEEKVPVESKKEKPEPETAEGGEEEPEKEAEPAFETKVTVHELHVSDQAPLGEATKTYVRMGSETAVATVMKATAETFKPVMAEWRDMRVTTVDVKNARSIRLTTSDGSASLFKRDGAWFFDPDGGRAEDSAVTDLLQAVATLTAVAFVDEDTDGLAVYGLDQPRGEIQLTIPGVEGVERIAVGGYTDEQTKRLVYVRRNDLTSIAKVRAADVEALLAGVQVYRDRTVLDVLPSRFERISLSAERRGLGELGGREKVTLQREGTRWRMVEPVEADVRADQMDKLVEALGGLRAEQVVEERGEPGTYGLDAPTVTVMLTYTSEDRAAGAEPPAPDQALPASQTIDLAVTEHDGAHYAKREDRGTIYRVSEEFFRQLTAEYHTDRVLDFAKENVQRFSIRRGDHTDVFDKRDGRWVYEAEPDLPLDTAKVDNLLLQLRDLRTNRYVRYEVDDLAPYGLSEPSREVTITLADGSPLVLRVSSQRGGEGPDAGFFASVAGRSGVFLLTDGSVRRFEVSLDQLE